MITRRFTKVTTAATVIVAAGLSGCSSHPATAPASHAKITIDGKDQNVGGSVLCAAAGGHVGMVIGASEEDTKRAHSGAQLNQLPQHGAVVSLTDANPPEVLLVTLTGPTDVNLPKDVATLGYMHWIHEGNAQATKNGNDYKITGTAIGTDTSNPNQPPRKIEKPFEIDVTCSEWVTPAPSSSKANAPASHAKVTIDGQDQNVGGPVTCATTGGHVAISIVVSGTAAPSGTPPRGDLINLTDDNPPRVVTVALTGPNGVMITYSQGVPMGNAQATKNGNSYKITGTALGVNMSKPNQPRPTDKPFDFEIDVTCS
jgi:ipoprotein LpqH